MEEIELVEPLKYRRVRDFYRSLCDKIRFLPPDGKTIHKRNGFGLGFASRAELYDIETDEKVKKETFDELSRRKPTLYKDSIQYILKAVNELHIQI